MKPYQERVVEEKFDLDNRRKRLSAFMPSDMFKTLPAAEQERMRRQLSIMADYSAILQERIDAFPKEVSPFQRQTHPR